MTMAATLASAGPITPRMLHSLQRLELTHTNTQ
jgi:hypothetical protein